MPKVNSNGSIKISELGNAGVLRENDTVPINALTAGGVPYTKSSTLNDFRQTLGFDNAFESKETALANTADGEVFFVYESSDHLYVLQYQNIAGAANPVLAAGGVQVKLATNKKVNEAIASLNTFFDSTKVLFVDQAVTCTRSDLLTKRIVWAGGTLNGMQQNGAFIPRVGKTRIPSSAFNYVSTFGIAQKSDGMFTVGIAPESLSPARNSTNIYYVDVAQTAAAGTQDGLTWATCYDSINKALLAIKNAAVTNAVIYVEEGYYPRNRKWDGTNPTVNLHVVAVKGHDITKRGTAISSTEETSITWTVDSTNVYKATRTLAGTVVLKADGTRLAKMAALETCRQTEHSWYTDGTLVYVHLAAGETGSDVRVFINETNGFYYSQESSTWYIEGLKFYGGNTAFQSRMMNTNASLLIVNNCEFAYHSGTGGTDSGNFSIFGLDRVYLFNCTTHSGEFDGFNYHADQSTASKAPKVFEYNCTGFSNGFSKSGTNNGSTAHDRSIVVRVNTVAYNNDGPGIVDVGNCKSWCMGCVSSDPTRTDGITKANYYFSQDAGLPGTAEAWLDSCVSFDGYYDLVTANGATTRLRNWRGGLLCSQSVDGKIEYY